MLSRMYTTMSNNGLVLGKLIQVPPSPPGFFFRLFFLDHVSMMGLGGGSTDDTWINFPTSVDIYIIYIYVYINMCQGLNSHYFHIVGDGHQPNSRGLYTHYKDSY